MICVVGVRGDIEVLLGYVLAARDRQGRLRADVTRIGGPAGRSFDGIVRLFDAHRRLRPSLGLHVGHASLRLAPRDRRLTHDEWRRAAACLAAGFGAQVWTTVRHGDDHVHVLWSRVRRDGTLVDHRYDRRRAETLTREIERMLGLEQVPCSWQLDPARAPAASRAPVPEAPQSVARRAAAWAAWQVSEAGGSPLIVELDRHRVQLCLDEEHRFCVDLGDGRREPLVRLLARCARRDRCRPPRERQILAGLDGMRLDTLSASRPEHTLDAPVSTSDECLSTVTGAVAAPNDQPLVAARAAVPASRESMSRPPQQRKNPSALALSTRPQMPRFSL